MSNEEQVEQQLIALKGIVERELGSLRQEIRDGFANVLKRFDDQAARLDRHAGLWQTGSRWSARMDAWAEKVDGSLEAKDREIAELRERLLRLERKSA